jgi:hypothetical protein
MSITLPQNVSATALAILPPGPAKANAGQNKRIKTKILKILFPIISSSLNLVFSYFLNFIIAVLLFGSLTFEV